MLANITLMGYNVDFCLPAELSLNSQCGSAWKVMR